MIQLGANQKKILLLLGTAVVFTFCPMTSKQVYRLVRSTRKDWQRINREQINRSMDSLRRRKLVTFKKDGKYFHPVLTREGKKMAEMYRMSHLRLSRPKVWDGIWRVVMFDIAEDDRKLRNYFRNQLKRLHFYELQKSVFVSPYPCRRHIERLSGLYQHGAAIRFLEATYVDNSKLLREHFHLR